MAQQIIDIGAAPNDGKGDPVRVAFNKVNQNFAELYRNSGSATTGTGYAGSRGYMGYVGSSGYSGSQGPVGPQGIGIRLLGRVATYTSLPTVGNSVGDAWVVAGDSNVYLWDTASSTWSNIGQIVGYSGSVGLQDILDPGELDTLVVPVTEVAQVLLGTLVVPVLGTLDL
jgi:hypothetical protein